MSRDALYAAVAFAGFGATLSAAADVTAASSDLITRGEYLAKAADCDACHTVPRGKPFAGGLAISSPVGVIYSTNITPSSDFGIGRYSETQFARALRRGIRLDGANLYPAMPYTSYSQLTDEDVHALYTFFMRSVAPLDEQGPRTKLAFPLNLRVSMSVWNLLFLNSARYKENPKQSAEWNRGRYLVDAAAHCEECHTPRGLLMQKKSSLKLAGAQVGAWYAPNITADIVSGVGSWRKEDLARYLRTGILTNKARAAGSMAEAVEHSFQYMTDADLLAMAAYVLTVPAIHDPADQTSRFSLGKPSSALGTLRGANGVRADSAKPTGPELFQANCASCHAALGQGTKDGYFPSLFSNSAVGSRNPNNMIATILNGLDRTTSEEQAYMPGFGGKPNDLAALRNEEIVLIGDYLIDRFGRGEARLTAAQVAEVRRGGPTSALLGLARVGVAAATACVIVALILCVRLMRRRRK